MQLDIATIDGHVRDLEYRFADRDRAMARVDLVRGGKIAELYPDYFSDDLPESIVANLIDVAAADLASVQAPLPSLACASGNMRTASDERRSGVKNRIGASYWEASRLSTNMVTFADGYNTYGFGVLLAEADFELGCPVIRVEDPHGVYYALDAHGRVRRLAKVRLRKARELADEFPHLAGALLTDHRGRARGESMLRMVHYVDLYCQYVYLPECGNLVLAHTRNVLSRLPAAIVERPKLTVIPRGQFDDVVPIQLARAIMATYQLAATDKSVNAPLILPNDVTEVNTGPDAVLRTDNPGAAGRLKLDLPPAVFGLIDQLDRESKVGSRYPDARVNGVQGSIVTGRGVEAMLGGFDTQIKQAQQLFAVALERVTSLCFELDVKIFGDTPRKIEGTASGRSFSLTYVPSKDIGDSWTCRTTYGFAAGMTPAQAIVMLLQLRGDKWIGRDTARSHMPFDINAEEEQRSLDVEEMEDALKQGMGAALQAIGPMVLQGQDPMPLLLAAASAIKDRQSGTSLYESILAAFTPPEPPPAPPGAELGAEGLPAAVQAGLPGGAPPEGELPNGIRDNGLTQGVAYGQAGMAPGGMPSIQSLIAGIKGNGSAQMEAATLRKRPIGDG